MVTLVFGRILIVKTSSMGDVVHALPAVSDIRRQRPEIAIDWLVEVPFAAIPHMHAAVGRVIPMTWRNWRKTLWRAETRMAVAALCEELRREAYDLVLDLQGLLKSAMWGLQARGPLVGCDRASIREPLAALCYARTATVSRELHAVERCRRLEQARLVPILFWGNDEERARSASPRRWGGQPSASTATTSRDWPA